MIHSQKNLVNQPNNQNSVFAINQMLIQNRQNYQNINQKIVEVEQPETMHQVELKQDVVIMDYDSKNSGSNDNLIHVELGMSNEAMIATEDNSEDLEFA